MRLVKPNVERVIIADPRKKIEACGRICYKSEDRITDTSASKFVAALIKRGHESVIEHANFIVAGGVALSEYIDYVRQGAQIALSRHDKNSKVEEDIFFSTQELRITINLDSDRKNCNEQVLVSANARALRNIYRLCNTMGVGFPFSALIEAEPWLFEDMPGIKEHLVTPKCRVVSTEEMFNGEYTHGEIMSHVTETIKFTVDRGISHELVRHRKHSMSQESSRYCNYTQDKFGKEISVIPANMLAGSPELDPKKTYQLWSEACFATENIYFSLVKAGVKPEMARGVLPTSTKTEIVMTATLAMWKHFCDLRCSVAAHPQMRDVAIPLMKMLLNEVYDWREEPLN